MMQAPDFTLSDQTNTSRSLTDYAGQWLVLYFYPEDDTPGCTVEACSFRDGYAELGRRGVAVVGVSPDSAQSHAGFADKHQLPFPLLADTSHTVMEAYGAWGPKKLYGKEYVGVSRKTFVINPDGQIAKEYAKVIPLGHAEQVIKLIDQLKAKPE